MNIRVTACLYVAFWLYLLVHCRIGSAKFRKKARLDAYSKCVLRLISLNVSVQVPAGSCADANI